MFWLKMRSKPLSFPRIAGRSSVRASGNPTWNSRVRARGICASRRRGRGRRATRGRNAPGIFLLYHPFCFCCSRWCSPKRSFPRRVPRAQRGGAMTMRKCISLCPHCDCITSRDGFLRAKRRRLRPPNNRCSKKKTKKKENEALFQRQIGVLLCVF